MRVSGGKLQNMRVKQEDGRGREVRVGAVIIVGIAGIVSAFLLGWRSVPGWVGESLGLVAGVMTTPFFMESFFVIVGLLTVVGLNTWRRRRGGDEFVEIEVLGADAVEKPRSEDTGW